ncbi:MAG: DUF1127 domain-containing protein [Primorskyibacter sp.]
MALTQNTQSHHAPLMLQFAHLKAEFDQWRARRATYAQTLRELRALSDRDLADLGLNRSMLRGVALEAAQQV